MSNRTLFVAMLAIVLLGVVGMLILSGDGREVFSESPADEEREPTGESLFTPDSHQPDEVVLPDSLPVLRPGDLAPDFQLTSLDGQSFRLSEQTATVVVLNFWATWCEPCHDEMPDLDMAHDLLKDEGVVIVGISMDEEGRDAVEAFHEAYPVQFPLLIDGLEVAEEYGAHFVVPTTYLVGRNGVIARRLVGAMERDELVRHVREVRTSA